MNTYEGRRISAHLALKDSNKVFIANERTITGNPELAPFRGKAATGDALDR